MKRTITAALICMMICASTAVVADDEVTQASSTSPLLPNFYPAAGQWILNSGLFYEEMTFRSNAFDTKVIAHEKIQFGYTAQTEFSVSQKYLLDRDPTLPRTRFYSPELSAIHRFVQSNDTIVSAAITYMPATDRSTLMQNKEQIRLFLDYSKLINEDYWTTTEVSFSHTGKRDAANDEETGALVSEVNSISAKFKLSKQIERAAYSAYLAVTKKNDYKFIPSYMNCYYYAPACTAYADPDLIPSFGVEVSHNLTSKMFIKFSYLAIHQTGTATIYPTGRPPSVRTQDTLRQIFGIHLINQF